MILCSLHMLCLKLAMKCVLKGITNTMLASSLRDLENDGLICRTQYDEMPVRVEYRLADACDDLMPILEKLAGWGAKR